MTNSTVNTSPFELLYGKKPRLSHIRIFGCLTFVKTQMKKRSGYQGKLEARANRGMLLGYDRDFSYKLFLLDEKKTILSRKVSFDETRSAYNSKIDISALGGDVIGQSDDTDPDESSEYEDQAEEGPCEPRYNLRRRGDEEANLAQIFEPTSVREALESTEAEGWLKAAKEEYDSLMKNETWTLVKRPPDCRPITSKWVFKLKMRNGQMMRYKCRLVARGFSQHFGYDYH